MKQALKDLLASKKFLVTLAAILVYVGGKLGLNLTTDQLMPVLALLASFVVGQGVADMGKEKAKVDSKGPGSA